MVYGAAILGEKFDPITLLPGIVATFAVIIMNLIGRDDVSSSMYSDGDAALVSEVSRPSCISPHKHPACGIPSHSAPSCARHAICSIAYNNWNEVRQIQPSDVLQGVCMHGFVGSKVLTPR